MTSTSRLKVAVCQYAPRLGRVEENATVGSDWITRAANAGAKLIVLPELANSGYAFTSAEEAELGSELAADGPTLMQWVERCRQLGVWVVAGFSERSPAGRFDSAALLGPDGVIGVYRKAHLFFNEQTYFRPGDTGFPVFELPFGRVGMLVCYDLWFPEAARVLSLAGADIICVPTNWVGNFRRVQDERGWTMGNYASVAVATQNQVFLAAADRIGTEGDIEFVGCSCVVGPDGWMLAGPAARSDEALLLADVDLSQSAAKKQRTPRNHALADRRPELYHELTESQLAVTG